MREHGYAIVHLLRRRTARDCLRPFSSSRSTSATQDGGTVAQTPRSHPRTHCCPGGGGTRHGATLPRRIPTRGSGTAASQPLDGTAQPTGTTPRFPGRVFSAAPAPFGQGSPTNHRTTNGPAPRLDAGAALPQTLGTPTPQGGGHSHSAPILPCRSHCHPGEVSQRRTGAQVGRSPRGPPRCLLCRCGPLRVRHLSGLGLVLVAVVRAGGVGTEAV